MVRQEQMVSAVRQQICRDELVGFILFRRPLFSPGFSPQRSVDLLISGAGISWSRQRDRRDYAMGLFEMNLH